MRWRRSALDVALFRIVVALLLGSTAEIAHAVEVAAATHATWQAPFGLGWFVALVPLEPGVVKLVRVVHYNAVALAAVGLFTRPACALLTLTSFYLLALSQLTGAVLHDMHLVWFAALLALGSPGEALAVDAWLARRSWWGDPRPARRHSLLLASVGVLLGLVYFFPGVWKLLTPGWALSGNVVNQMHAKWFQNGVVPVLRIDHAPHLVQLGASLAIAFELGFVLVVQLGERARIALALAGLCFHLSIQWFLQIPFASLWLCYVALVPWSRWRRRAGDTTRRRAGESRMQNALICAFTGTLAVLLIERGVRGESESWPVACYPRFHRPMAAELPDLRVTALGPEGERPVPIGRDAAGHRRQSEWATVWSVAGIYGVPFSRARLQGYLREQAQRPHVAAALNGATQQRVELVYYRTEPEAWGAPPTRITPLVTLDAR